MYQVIETDAKLISQEQVGASGPDWHLDALRDLESRLLDPGFPCVFAKNAARKKIVTMLFVEDTGSSGIRHLAAGLADFVERSRDWDGRLDSAPPLVVAFAPDAVYARTVGEYHSFGWRVLRSLHALDPRPWPAAISRDPDTDSWSMCFNGMALFVNMSSPAHHVRRSRNLGRHFVLVVNPRERFDVFAGDTPSGRKVRANIRARIGRYDGAPHAWQLGSYGTGALEWRQYGLVEENVERADRCPFRLRTPDPRGGTP
ncbi:YqcI/YcgG family protein [Actinokineospora sp. NBRC 105648]|uniref:YqcI/YcgG family protein n=1 Tax=Actinokineospora sp. NBRC 105648 TaxID=3032206 RepID=UPI0024A4A22A|nr:YqcI/YcgG family protein [Actinokineospora sp. NBRC 105648]GLZ38067.1 hypothetical protein Acsp05_16910 [Actinokineospora sp. NBRC 105648]